MAHKSCNHLSITARPTADAKTFNDNSVARMRLAHNIGNKVFYVDAVFYAHKGTKLQREIPVEKLAKGVLSQYEGYLQPKTDKDGKVLSNDVEYVITKVLEPQVIAEGEPEASEEEAEAETATEE